MTPRNITQSDNVTKTILSLIQDTGLIDENKENTHAWNVSKNLLSGFVASFCEQTHTIEGLLEYLTAIGLDDDHSKKDGGKPDGMIEAERVLRDAKNYLDVWDRHHD